MLCYAIPCHAVVYWLEEYKRKEKEKGREVEGRIIESWAGLARKVTNIPVTADHRDNIFLIMWRWSISYNYEIYCCFFKAYARYSYRYLRDLGYIWNSHCSKPYKSKFSSTTVANSRYIFISLFHQISYLLQLLQSVLTVLSTSRIESRLKITSCSHLRHPPSAL